MVLIAAGSCLVAVSTVMLVVVVALAAMKYRRRMQLLRSTHGNHTNPDGLYRTAAPYRAGAGAGHPPAVAMRFSRAGGHTTCAVLLAYVPWQHSACLLQHGPWQYLFEVTCTFWGTKEH